jgi:thiaminase
MRVAPFHRRAAYRRAMRLELAFFDAALDSG